MQACHVATPSYITTFIEQLRKRIQAPDFSHRHKRRSKDFTRHRKLPFEVVLLLLLQKTTQSIQRHLDDYFLHSFWVLHLLMPSPTAGAWTQARAKFKASAFDELNYQMVVPFLYGPEHQSKLRLWRDMRLLAIDGTELNIPVTGRLAQRFRVLRSAPAKKPGWARGLARLSVLYDVLNRVALDAQLVSDRVGERKLALQHIGHMQPNDLVLMDCGYHGFTLLAALSAAHVQFVIRCSRKGFFEARKLLGRTKPTSAE
ncbi:MAG: putative transposase, IS4-family [Verrucomicrobiales bacterium]|nr:putative transposase, IS4-family [Verrucomicrobiales bacterium]